MVSDCHPVSFPPLQFYVAASLKLEHLVKCPTLMADDVHFILSNLARVLSEAVDNGNDVM